MQFFILLFMYSGYKVNSFIVAKGLDIMHIRSQFHLFFE